MTSRSRKLARRVVATVHALLQRIVAPGERRVSFTSIPDYTDSAFAVYRRALLTRRNLHITWLVVDLSISERIHREFDQLLADHPDHRGHSVRVRSRHSARGYFAYLRSRVVIHTHGVFAFARSAHRRQIVSLWHGMPIKAVGSLNYVTPGPKSPYGSIHVATSDAFKYMIAAAFRVVPERVLLTALPRTDALADGSLGQPDDKQVRTRLGLPHDRPLIFWMPTFRTQANAAFVLRRTDEGLNTAKASGEERSFLDDMPATLLDELSAACARHGCEIVIKLHPLDCLNRRPVDRDLDHLTILTSERFIDSELQLYDVLATCDALMTDVSSVLIDFETTGRPIGLIGLPVDTYERNLVLPLEMFSNSPRFDHLVDGESVDRFVSTVAAGGPGGSDPSLSAFLHRRFPDPGAETVLAEVDLPADP